MQTKHWIAFGVLIALWLAETWWPFFTRQNANWSERLRHDARNLLWGAINAALAVTVLTVFTQIELRAEANQFGLLRQFHLPAWLTIVAAVILLDFWTYWWHRLNHIVPFLWRFHRMHHTDTAMDTSTGVRFHTGEIALSWMARLAVVPLLGVNLVQLATYESLLLPVVLFHHSNLRLPRWLDFGLLSIMVTPLMHRVHHSQEKIETNSNYGSLLPWWDMLFGSFQLRQDPENIRYGVEEFASPDWQTLGGMARTPLTGKKDLQN